MIGGHRSGDDVEDRPSDDAEQCRGDRRTAIIYTAAIVSMLAMALLGPPIVDALSSRGSSTDPQADLQQAVATSTNRPAPDRDSSTSIDSAASTDAATSTSADPTTVPTAGSTTIPENVPTTVPETVLTTVRPNDPDVSTSVETIQFVPPLRDVIAKIGGREYASDENGRIAIDPASSGADFGFVGIRAQPSLSSVTFARWADGTLNAERSLSDVEGPIAQIGLVEDVRITVSTRQTAPENAQIEFTSAAGAIRLDVGQTVFVPARRAVPTEEGLVTEALSYSTTTLVADSSEKDIVEQSFRPTPEALWLVDIG